MRIQVTIDDSDIVNRLVDAEARARDRSTFPYEVISKVNFAEAPPKDAPKPTRRTRAKLARNRKAGKRARIVKVRS